MRADNTSFLQLSYSSDSDRQFSEFCAQYGKSYVEQEEYQMRKSLFEKSLQLIQQFNENDNDQDGDGILDIDLSVNWMADLTEDEKRGSQNDLGDFNRKHAEFIKQMTDNADIFDEDGVHDIEKHTGSKHPLVKYFSAINIPESIDWRDYNAVSPVTSQGRCGSCWAFASVGVIESALAIKTNTTAIHLSVQQAVDCVKSTPKKYRISKQCKGGHGFEVFEYFKNNYLLEAKQYPYRAKGKECRINGTMITPRPEKRNWFSSKIDNMFINYKSNRVIPLIKTKKHYRVNGLNSVLALKRALLIGPVYMSVTTKNIPFEFYRRGIIDSQKCTGVHADHVVLAIGYGVDRTKQNLERPYVIIKNSWGKWWGDNGYAKISMDGKKFKSGVCHIFDYNFLALIDTKYQSQEQNIE